MLGEFAGWCILAIGLVVVAEVAARYLLRNPQVWAMETTQYLQLTFIFLGCGYTLLAGGHLKVELLLTRLSKKSRNVLNTITSILGLACCSVFTIQIWLLALRAFRGHWLSTSVLAVYQFPLYVLMIVGGISLIMGFLNQALLEFGAARRGSGTKPEDKYQLDV